MRGVVLPTPVGTRLLDVGEGSLNGLAGVPVKRTIPATLGSRSFESRIFAACASPSTMTQLAPEFSTMYATSGALSDW